MRQVLLALALFAVALAIRLPNLMLIPRFEDEGVDAVWALDVALGRHFPLTGPVTYLGPFFTYVLALIFRVLGVNLLWPRLLVAVTGALAVPATYFLGRRVSGERVGFIAALCMMTNPTAIVIVSHFGWSACMGPTLLAITLATMAVGVEQHRIGAIAAAGLLAGLCLQVNPLSAVVLAGGATWAVAAWDRREVFWRGAAAGLAGLAIGYAPMLWTLATSSNELVGSVTRQSYVYAPLGSLDEYFARLLTLSTAALMTAAGAHEGLWAAFGDVPQAVIRWTVGVLIVAGMLVHSSVDDRRLVSRPRVFLFCSVVIPVFLLPLVAKSFYSRHLALLLPPACICAGRAFLSAWDGAVALWTHLSGQRVAKTASAAGAALAALLVLLAVDLRALHRIERQHIQDGTTNAVFLKLAETIAPGRLCPDHVFLQDMNPLEMGIPPLERTWVYFNYQAVRLVLALKSCSSTIAPAETLVDLVSASTPPAWLIVPEKSFPLFAPRLDVERVLSIAPGPPVPDQCRLQLLRVRPS